MTSNPLFYQWLLIALVLICLLTRICLSDNPPRVPKAPLQPNHRQRSKEPKPFTGVIHKPRCEACEQGADARPKLRAEVRRGTVSTVSCEDVLPPSSPRLLSFQLAQ